MISNEFLCGFVVFTTGSPADPPLVPGGPPIVMLGSYNIKVIRNPAILMGSYLLQLGLALNPPSGDDLDAEVTTERTPAGKATGWNLKPTSNPGEYQLDLWESAGLGNVVDSNTEDIFVRVAIKRVEPRTTVP